MSEVAVRLISNERKTMSHIFSDWLDEDVIRCENCGKNVLSARGTTCEGSLYWHTTPTVESARVLRYTLTNPRIMFAGRSARKVSTP